MAGIDAESEDLTQRIAAKRRELIAEGTVQGTPSPAAGGRRQRMTESAVTPRLEDHLTPASQALLDAAGTADHLVDGEPVSDEDLGRGDFDAEASEALAEGETESRLPEDAESVSPSSRAPRRKTASAEQAEEILNLLLSVNWPGFDARFNRLEDQITGLGDALILMAQAIERIEERIDNPLLTVQAFPGESHFSLAEEPDVLAPVVLGRPWWKVF